MTGLDSGSIYLFLSVLILLSIRKPVNDLLRKLSNKEGLSRGFLCQAHAVERIMVQMGETIVPKYTN